MRWRAILTVAALLSASVDLSAAPAQPEPVESLLINDSTYGQQRRIWIVKAPASQPPVNLFLFLNGETYLTDLALPSTLQALVSSGKIPPAIAVLVDTSSQRPAELANRAKFAQFITRDLMPQLAQKLGRLPEAKHVAIGGCSVGGVTAAYLAFRHPELFGNVLSQSGAFWRGNEGASEPAEWLTQQLREKPRLPIRFYVEVGGEETVRTPSGVVFIEANRHLRDVLAAKKYTFRYVEVPGAHHDEAHWRDALAAGIMFLSQSTP